MIPIDFIDQIFFNSYSYVKNALCLHHTRPTLFCQRYSSSVFLTIRTSWLCQDHKFGFWAWVKIFRGSNAILGLSKTMRRDMCSSCCARPKRSHRLTYYCIYCFECFIHCESQYFTQQKIRLKYFVHLRSRPIKWFQSVILEPLWRNNWFDESLSRTLRF